MSNRPNHRESSQEVLNEARDSVYGTVDVTPMVETTPGSVAQKVTGTVSGASVGVDVNIIGGTITGSDGAILDGANSAIKATVKDLANSNPLTAAIVDGNGDQITSFGGGTQYTEADTDASITGTAMMMEGAANTLVPAQGTAADGLLVNLGTNNDISGTVTANAGTNLNTSLLALEAGGNLATIAGKDFATQTTLALIKAKTDNIPAQGQALAAASVPVVLTAAQITTLTPPAAITGFATAAAQTDKSQFTKITDGTDTALVTAAGEQNVIATAQPGVDIGDVTVNNATLAVTQSGTWDEVGINDSGNVITVDGSGSAGSAAAGVVTVQGVASMTPVQVSQATASNLNATVVQGTATNLKAQAETYQGGSAVGVANPLQVSLANHGANATAVKVDGSAVTQPVSGTFWQVTQPVSLASVPSHAVTNAGTFAVQESGSALTALQVIDNFISGARGLVTEDNSAAIKTAVEAIDNSVDGNYLNTNMNVAGTDAAADTGVTNAQTQRVTQALNDDWITLRVNYAASAQTNTSMITAGANEKIYVKHLTVTADNANTVDTAVLIGWDDTTTPTGADCLLSHPGIAPGSGLSEFYGSDGVTGSTAADDLKITSEAATSGSISVVIIYKIV